MAAIIDWSAPLDYRTALHEAGHAVIGRVVGLGCGGAGLVHDGTRVGFAEIERPWLGWQRGDGSRKALVESYIVAVFAGSEAERYALGAPDGGEWQDEDNIYEAMKHLRIKGCSFVGDDVWVRCAARLRLKARRLAARYWPAIERVAVALVQHRVLDAAQVDRLLGSDR